MQRWSLSVALGCVMMIAFSVAADENFDRLFKAGKYKDAIDYADESIPPATRPADVWVKIAQANEQLGLFEKALACYLVSSRMNPKDYDCQLGAARIYNKMADYEPGLTYGRKALDINFTGEASWEYALACIKLNKSAEAKMALEKVIETDPTNAVANRELGNIYYDGKEYAKALPLLRKSFDKKADSDVAYKVGKAALESNDLATASQFLKEAAKSNSVAGLELARTYFGLNDFANAAPEYDRALSRTRGSAIDYYQAAVSKDKSGDSKGALKSYVDAIGQFGSAKTKEALNARIIAGRAQLADKNFNDALGNLKFIKDADPKREIAQDIYFLLADAYEGAKQSPLAIQNLEKALSIDGKNVEAYARLADLYKRAGQEDKAKATYEKMIGLSPNDPNIYMILGDYNIKVNRNAEALKYYEKAFVLGRLARAAEGIAISASALGQWDKAGDAAESAVSLEATLLPPRIVLSKFYMQKENYTGALKQLELLVDKDPANLEYWKNLAKCYDKTGNTDKLSKADQKVMDLDKKDVDSRLRFADYSLNTKKDAKTATATYKELSVLAPNNATVLKNLYVLSRDAKDASSALDYVKKYLSLNSKDAEAQRDLGDFLYDKKDLDGALGAYRQALAIDPAIKGFLKRYAEIVVAKGQPDEAIKALGLKIKSGEASADDYSTLGMIYQRKKVYPSAIENYQKSLQVNPQNLEVLTSLAETQASAGQAGDAIVTYEQVIMMNTKASGEYKSLGDLYLSQKKTDLAMKAYRKYLETLQSGAADNAVAKVVSDYLIGQKSYDDALKYLAMITGADAQNPDLQVMIADAAFNTKKYKRTIEICEAQKGASNAGVRVKASRLLAQAYELDGQDAKAAAAYASYSSLPGVRDEDAAFKAANMREKGDKPGAQKIYEQNISKYPKDYRNYLQLGLIYSEKRETLTKSIETFKKISSMADSIPLIWFKLGEVYGKMNKSEDELSAFKNFVKFEPQNPEANKRIGLNLVRTGKFKEGLIYLETASTLAPKDVDVFFSLAEGYAKTNRSEEAISALEKALSHSPKDLKIVQQLYRMYMKVGRSKDARKQVETLVALNPDDPDVRFLHARLLLEDKQYGPAATEIENIMAAVPNAEAQMLLGEIRTGEKKYDDALKVYDEALLMEDATPQLQARALYEKAELYRLYGKQLGKSPKWAETFYERALRSDPTFGLAKLGLARLQRLWNRQDLYKKYLAEAYSIDPGNKEIQDEYNKMK